MSVALGWLTVIALIAAGPWLIRLAQLIHDAQRANEARWENEELAAWRRCHERVTGGR